MARGSWLVARGSWLVARGSWLVSKGRRRVSEKRELKRLPDHAVQIQGVWEWSVGKFEPARQQAAYKPMATKTNMAGFREELGACGSFLEWYSFLYPLRYFLDTRNMSTGTLLLECTEFYNILNQVWKWILLSLEAVTGALCFQKQALLYKA